jgi:formate dehydrogenase iron-sulfur subunit
VRAKPPLPAHKGLFGKPTVINNVLSLRRGAVHPGRRREAYADFGMGRSRGTMPIQLAGNVKHGGLFETAFGITLGELVDDIGGGTAAAGRCARCRSAARSAPISRARCSTRRSTTRPSPRADGLIGHGGIVVFDDTVDMAEAGALRDGILRHRILRQVHALPHRLDPRRRDHRQDHRRASARGEIALLEDLCNTMKFGSLCALGGFTPYPVMSALTISPKISARGAACRRRNKERRSPCR